MQLALDIAVAPLQRTRRARRPKPARPSLAQRFAAFHEANPHVYATLVRLAREARAAGKERLGMKALWERLRWELEVVTRGDEFRCNNNYTAAYARLLMDNEPDLAGLFETRRRRTA
jgi:hypothetical protein